MDLPNGRSVDLEVIHHPGAAAIVACDDLQRVTLVHQFRHAVGGYIWEIPAGKLEPGEAPELCARRELIEEAGQRAADIVHLGSIVTAPGFCDERIHLYLARQLTPEPQNLDHDEVLTVTTRPLVEALEMIRTGELQDAKSIAGLHLAAAYLEREQR